MAMVIGSADAESGMSKEIFEQMDILLTPALQEAVDAATGDAGQAVPAPPGPHTHQISLTATQQGVTFNQSGNVNGHLK